jgi:hypothetical protein
MLLAQDRFQGGLANRPYRIRRFCNRRATCLARLDNLGAPPPYPNYCANDIDLERTPVSPRFCSISPASI